MEDVLRISSSAQFEAFDGLEAVLDSFDTLSYQSEEPKKFYNLVKTLKHEESQDTRAITLRLVNAMLYSAKLDRRRGLRAQLHGLGLLEVIDSVHSHNNLYDILTLICIWLSRLEARNYVKRSTSTCSSISRMRENSTAILKKSLTQDLHLKTLSLSHSLLH